MAALTAQEQRAIADVLKARSTGGTGCMTCGGFEWDLSEEEVTVPTRAMSSTRGIPCAASVCRGCGLVALYSLVALGIRKAGG